LQHVTPLNRDQLISLVRGIRAEGGTIYTDSFRFVKSLFDQAVTPSERKRIVLFFSDGEPQDQINLSVIDTLFATYPALILYVISMGNGVNASRKMIPLLRDRPFELGRYIDCPNMEEFSAILTSVVGDIAPTFATNMSIRFIGATPSSSLAQRNDDGSFVVTVPIVNENEALNIAFQVLPDTPFSITYSFTRDGEVIEGSANPDEAGIIPIEISKHFTSSRMIKDKMNEIITNNTSSPTEKQTLLTSLLTQISEEEHGTYFHEMKETIESRILSYDTRYRNDNQVQNRSSSSAQYSQRMSSAPVTSRALSSNIRTFTGSATATVTAVAIPEEESDDDV
jgi:hypothetical protein